MIKNCQPKGSHFIAGAYCDDNQGVVIESLYPATGEVLARLHAGTPKIIETAISSAKEGQALWALMPAAQRGRCLLRAAQLIRERNEELSQLETLDTGKPLQETRVADAVSGAECLEYFGGMAASITGQYIDLGSSFAYTRREALGVCLGIGAWNYPIQIACWKSAPALACGNAMIFKPSSTTPLTALKLAEIYKQAGVPDGVFNVVQGDRETARSLIAHHDIAKISLTGSVSTGKAVMRQAAEGLKPVTLELGGKSPLLIFADSDLDQAVLAAMNANFYSTGQICTNGTRVFVEKTIEKPFLEKLVEKTSGLILGDPLDDATQIGPLISQQQRETVLNFITIGKKEGAHLCIGGNIPHLQGMEKGWFIEPTIFSNVQDNMVLAREEIFGPVMSVLTFDSEEEVIKRANDTIFGLAAGVFTKDLKRAHSVVAKLQAGICWINNYNLTPVEMPFGGMKHSGIGRENAHAAIEHYSQLKSVYVEMNQVESPYG